MTAPQAPQAHPQVDLDFQLSCPRGRFSVELLNALDIRFRGWREVTATRDNIDFFGLPIKRGESHYFRATGPGFESSERLTALSMDKLLWLMFGVNQGLAEFCQQTSEQQKAQEARAMQAAVNALGARPIEVHS